MKHIGIITLLNSSINYGGVLQAYALAKWLGKEGHHVVQIDYDRSIPSLRGNSILKFVYLHLVGKKRKNLNADAAKYVKSRRSAFESFIKRYVPVTQKTYNANTIKRCVKDFDIFIAGSDQIWNGVYPNANRAFLLDFVPDKKKKIAYAASITRIPLKEKQIPLYKKYLNRLDAISVREDEAKEYLEKEIENDRIVCTVDPTQLLSDHEWDEIACNRLISEPYIFVYLLSEKKENMDVLRAFANKRGLRIISIPCADGHFDNIPQDDNGLMWRAGPQEFVSLIKYADYVVTDSYHAASFSVIYHKAFSVIERAGSPQMAIRILTLLNSVGMEDRFVRQEIMTEADLHDFENLAQCDYTEFEQKREMSIKFLRDSISND